MAEAARLQPAGAVPRPRATSLTRPRRRRPSHTPLPIYAEYSGSEELTRVIVKYKGAGMGDWKTLELKKSDSGYGGLIPCKDVDAGDDEYFIQGFDAAGRPRRHLRQQEQAVHRPGQGRTRRPAAEPARPGPAQAVRRRRAAAGAG